MLFGRPRAVYVHYFKDIRQGAPRARLSSYTKRFFDRVNRLTVFVQDCGGAVKSWQNREARELRSVYGLLL